jgi:hypothetical protein
MGSLLSGLAISVLVLFVFLLLLRYESRRGVRFLNKLRSRIDFFLIKTTYQIHSFTRRIWKDYLQQIFHYSFHTLLRKLLALVQKSEDSIRTAMRVNKSLAKNAERESATLSKLDEVALHKATMALTEDEKRIRKDRTLQGN